MDPSAIKPAGTTAVARGVDRASLRGVARGPARSREVGASMPIDRASPDAHAAPESPHSFSASEDAPPLAPPEPAPTLVSDPGGHVLLDARERAQDDNGQPHDRSALLRVRAYTRQANGTVPPHTDTDVAI